MNDVPTPTQLALPMLTVYTAPVFVAAHLIAGCDTWRAAVRMAYDLRQRRQMTRRQLAEEVGCWPSHLTDYLCAEPRPRELPARFVAAFESAVGNRVLSQWLVRQSHLSLVEEILDNRRAA